MSSSGAWAEGQVPEGLGRAVLGFLSANDFYKRKRSKGAILLNGTSVLFYLLSCESEVLSLQQYQRTRISDFVQEQALLSCSLARMLD